MNKSILIGNLTRDPEGGNTQSGITWCRFTLAVNRRYADQSGQRQTDFFTIVAWRGIAESCIRYLSKGRKVGVVGHLENRSYDGQDGQKHYVTEIIAEEIEFLTPKGGTISEDQDDASY